MAFNLVSAEQIKAVNLDDPNLPEDGGSGMTIKVDTAANLTKENPILLKGQLGAESDTTYMKLGDGVTAWNDLEYIKANKSVQDAVGNVIADTYLKKSGGTMTGAIAFSDSNKASISLKNDNGFNSGIGFTETSILVLTGENGIFFTPTVGGAQTYIDADGYHGNVDGTATKATQDDEGNAIVGTYATKTELSGKQDKLIFDTTPTANSTNPVTSDGVKKYVDSAIDALDSVLTTLNADDKSY